jgi:protein gp37
MHPDWARSTIRQCEAAGTPVFFKQWGEWGLTGDEYNRGTHVVEVNGRAHSRSGEGLEAIGDRGASIVARLGKKAAGRELDGRTHDGFPG